MRISRRPSAVLLLAAVACFALATIGVDVRVDLVPLGLAFGFAAFLVDGGGLLR